MRTRAAGRLEATLALSLLSHLLVAGAALVATRARAERPEPAVAAPPLVGLAGDTFEVGRAADDETTDTNEAVALPAPASPPSPAPAATADGAPREPAAASPARASTRASSASPETGASGASGASSPPKALFGAVGERSAVDLVAAFQRAFAQTASADPAWAHAPLGTAGSASLGITLDASGHIAASQLGAGAGTALTSSVQRTLTLLAHRPFVARSAHTTLALTARISADTAHDGLHGDRFALGVGETAWFALPSGRRIDLHVAAR